jgi:hypothetical protein
MEVSSMRKYEKDHKIAEFVEGLGCHGKLLKYVVSDKHQVVWIEIVCPICNEKNNLLIQFKEGKHKVYVNPKQKS